MEGWWGGLKGVELTFAEADRDGDWHGHIVIHAAGVLRWLGGFVTEIDGYGPENAASALPQSYRQHVRSRRSDRIVEIGFAGYPVLGQRISDIERFADAGQSERDPENVPELPAALREATMDPLAAILTVGRRALAGEREFTLGVYDGRRRYDLAVTVRGAGTHTIAKQTVATLDATVIVHPIGGFKPFHLKWWTDAKFDVALDPSTGMPLRIASDSFISTVVLTAQAVCPPETGCETAPGK